MVLHRKVYSDACMGRTWVPSSVSPEIGAGLDPYCPATVYRIKIYQETVFSGIIHSSLGFETLSTIRSRGIMCMYVHVSVCICMYINSMCLYVFYMFMFVYVCVCIWSLAACI